jgi:ATP-dependent RNA circularization protein (DNA/RNA ligase family)
MSSEGQEVLRELLNDWCFFDICKTDQQRTLNEYAKVFLHERLGLARVHVYAELDPEFERELQDTEESF